MNEQQLQQAFIQYLAQKTGAKSQQELETVIQQMGEEGLQQAYAEFMQFMQQQQIRAAKFGAKLNYIKQLRGQCPDGYEVVYFKDGGEIKKGCKACQKAQEIKEPSNPIDAFKCGRKMKKKENGGSVEKKKEGGKYTKSDDGEIYKEKITKGNKSMEKISDEGGYTIRGYNGKKGVRAHGMKSDAVTDSLDRAWDNEKKRALVNKKACGGQVKKDQKGGEIWTAKQSGFLPRTTIFRTIQYPKKFEEGVPDTIYDKRVSYGLPFTTDQRQTGKVIHDRTGYYNSLNGNRTEAWTHKVSPSGRATSGQYNQLRDEYNKMK